MSLKWQYCAPSLRQRVLLTGGKEGRGVRAPREQSRDVTRQMTQHLVTNDAFYHVIWIVVMIISDSK